MRPVTPLPACGVGDVPDENCVVVARMSREERINTVRRVDRRSLGREERYRKTAEFLADGVPLLRSSIGSQKNWREDLTGNGQPQCI